MSGATDVFVPTVAALHIRILTFGDKGKPGPMSNRDWLRHEYRVYHEVHQLVMATGFRNPEKDGGTCAGYHPDIICRVIHHEEFEGWLREARNEFLRKVRWHDPRMRFTIAVGCRAGKHRSVAGSLILDRLLRDQGHVVSVQHLSSHTWHRRKARCCMGECLACRSVPAYLVTALERASQIWKQT